MPSDVLTVQSQVMCPHGGNGTAIPSQIKASAESGLILVETDKHIVAGCAFMKGQQPSPCVRIEWSAGAQKVQAGGTAVLTNQSIGQCYGPDNSVQGVAVIVNTKKAHAT
jgi:hypothetical protein